MRKRYVLPLTLVALLCLALSVPVHAGNYFETLKQDQKIDGFSVKTVYENSTGKLMGARFVSDKYGFIIDLMQIQSIPQGYFWVKTPIYDDRGEPHACEHLLLGKGNRGRYVATLEDMALSSSSAYTSQDYTCYHFNTSAGEDTFYKLFEAKLDALLNPDFTDEEIRREVCNIGVSKDAESGELVLEEKGTVYTEMVSSFEKYWYHLFNPMETLMYGADHPLANVSGGAPDAMRTMVPQDLWDFHKQAYRLGNMGVIVSIPDNIDVSTFLSRIDGALNRCQKTPEPDAIATMQVRNFPPAQMTKPFGTVKVAHYPSDNPEDPGYLLFGYPPQLSLDYRDLFLCNLFLETFAGGPTSNLYDLFINSQTRKIDLGGNTVYGNVDTEGGNPITFALNGIKNVNVSEKMLDSVRAMITAEIQRVYDLPDGSPEIAKFNENALSRLTQDAKQYDDFMNSPPMFGYRGTGGGWYYNLKSLEDESGFRKSLVHKQLFDEASKLLATDRNIWKDNIDTWKLLSVEPYAVGASPSADMIKKSEADKVARINAYVDGYKKQYDVTDAQQAIARYQEDFDKNTAKLEAVASTDERPHFIDNPPLTLDDQLKYEVMQMPGNVPMVASTFDNMTSATVGMAMRLDVLPESMLVYVPLIPDLLTDIGVYKDGEVVPFDEMQNRTRNEILRLRAYYDMSTLTGRRELVINGAGGNLEELKAALGWMNAALYSPYLSVDNLPRINDVIDQTLVSLRNRMKGSEESWVNTPAAAYRYQTDPLYMSASNFLTQTHHVQRMKWFMTDPGTEDDQKALGDFLTALKVYGADKNREELGNVFTIVDNPEVPGDEALKPVATLFNSPYVSESAKSTAKSILTALKATLPEIPDADLSGDWAYLCDETRHDLMVKPEQAIASINYALDLMRRADNARMFMISSSAARNEAMGEIKQFAGRLDTSAKSTYQKYSDNEHVLARVKDRNPDMARPVYAGLVNEGTRNGVLVFTATTAGVYDTTRNAILNSLAGKLYGGGGAHGLFMKTWGAGLAYSNGFGYGDQSGRVSYYAERCPDVAQTMQFVVNVLKDAEDDPYLSEYAIAQAFGSTRAGARYERRGEAMAADLADGFTPDVVRNYRQSILKVRSMPNLYEELKSRMANVYGQVLIGYGPPLEQSKNGCFFVIGPNAQFESLSRYIESTEGIQNVCHLYPRDFWLTM